MSDTCPNCGYCPHCKQAKPAPAPLAPAMYRCTCGAWVMTGTMHYCTSRQCEIQKFGQNIPNRKNPS